METPYFTHIQFISQILVDSVDSSSALSAIVFFVFLFCVRWWYKRKIDLDCWFCGHINHVTRSSRQWWMCSSCSQFNGFKDDGSYAREIPEMYKGSDSPTRFCEQEKFMKTTNFLCSTCIKNQRRIVQAIADFNPSNDRYFDEELECYKRELNGQFGLCLPCKTGVDHHLRSQDELIRNEHNQSIRNTLPRKSERKVRKLSMTLKNDSLVVVVAYNLLRLASFCCSHWLSRHHRANHKTDLVLFNISLIYIAAVIFLYFYVNKYDISGVLVSVGWFTVLCYGNFKTRDSRYLRSMVLSGIVMIEGAYLGYKTLLFICRIWKSLLYRKERKGQLEKIKRSPKLKTKTLTAPSQPTAAKPLPLLSCSETLTAPSQPTAAKSLPLLSCSETEVKSAKSSNETDIKSTNTMQESCPSTPDLLEGHLDAMFIQRKRQGSTLLREGKDKNHVVSALKYRGVATSNTTLSSRVPGQLLKPATFSSNLLRPSLFNSASQKLSLFQDVGLSKSKNSTISCNTSENGTILIEDSKNMSVAHEQIGTGMPTCPPEVCRGRWIERSSVINVLVIFFVVSILTNLVLVYQLISA